MNTLKDKLTPNDFDEDGKLKPSLLITFSFIYCCKALFIVAFSIFTLGKSTDALIATIYNDTRTFVFHLVTGFLSLPVLYVFYQRKSFKEKSKKLVSKIILTGLPILIFLDFTYLIYDYFTVNSLHSILLTTFLFVDFYLFTNILFSPREKSFRAEY